MEKSYPDFLFYEFFMALREKGLELGFNQYDWFLQSFLQTKPQSEAELLNLLKTIWLTRLSFREEFEQLFDAHFRKIPNKFLLIAKIPEMALDETLLSKKDDTKNSDTDNTEIKKALSQQKADVTPNPLLSKETPKSEPNIELWLSIDTGVAAGKNTAYEGVGSLLKTEYIFNDAKHLPFSVRKTGQTLRKINTRIIYEKTDRLNFQALIKQRVQDGFIHQLVYETQKRGVQEIIWLSDHSSANLPYEPWNNALRQIVADCPSVEKINQYFFHIYPSSNELRDDFTFFENRAQTKSILLSDILRKCTKYTVVIIFSDAGAARRQFDAEQLQIHFALTNTIRTKTKRFIWLNPVQRLNGTTAGYLSFMIPMRYPNNDDIRHFVTEI